MITLSIHGVRIEMDCEQRKVDILYLILVCGVDG